MTRHDKARVGMIGMGVMGRNLALNMADHSLSVAVWNLEPEMTAAAIDESGGRLDGTSSLQELTDRLERPRTVLLMVTAGEPVDVVLEQLGPLLQPGDIVIDGGNSWFEDTRRREARLSRDGVHFLGVGISGGEEGARRGPALMSGGSPEAYTRVAPLLQAIAAGTDSGPCVTHVGPDGAGHFVKMVHNGIEYADMQLIAEAYHLLREINGLRPPDLARIFEQWNRGELGSFLIGLTAGILTVEDAAGGWLVDHVLDRAGQKGTGRWTVQAALDLGVPVPSIAAAVDARVLSRMRQQRVRASELLRGPQVDEGALSVEAVHEALLAAKIVAHAQGMALIAAASDRFDWSIDPREIARIWKGGCIIRARLLDTMMQAYGRSPGLENLLLDEEIGERVKRAQGPWRQVVVSALLRGVPVPAMAASLAYLDSLRSASLPQNLIQAQRDAFGAHTYQRTDDPDGRPVHSEWPRRHEEP